MKKAIAVASAVVALVATGCTSSSSSGSKAGATASGAASGGAGTASATGVTATTITTGIVATTSGPVPGLFQGAIDGVDAYYAYVNSTGGVNGRTLKSESVDDAFNCGQNLSSTKDAAAKDFAIVGSFSVFDSCSLPYVKATPTLPYVAVSLSTPLTLLPNEFSPEPVIAGYRSGADKYLMQHYGVSKMAFLNPQTGAQNGQYEIDAAKSAGATIAYTRTYSSTETDFTSDVVRMKQAGVDWVNLSALTGPTLADALDDMAQQNFKPKVVQAGAAYTGSLFSSLQNKSAAEGVLIDQTFARYLGEDQASVPAVGTFNTWLQKAHPGTKPDLFTLYGWTSAELFVDALKNAGQNPTRASVLAALGQIHTFDASGLFAPDDPAGKKPSVCWLLLQVKGTSFNRLMPTDKGFTCDPNTYYTPS